MIITRGWWNWVPCGGATAREPLLSVRIDQMRVRTCKHGKDLQPSSKALFSSFLSSSFTNVFEQVWRGVLLWRVWRFPGDSPLNISLEMRIHLIKGIYSNVLGVFLRQLRRHLEFLPHTLLPSATGGMFPGVGAQVISRLKHQGFP